MATRTTRSRTAKMDPEEGISRSYGDTEYREPGEAYDGPVPTKGMYRFKLVDARYHETQDGNASTHWTFEILPGELNKHDEEVAGWRGHKYTNDEAAKFIEQQIAVALGLMKPGGELNMKYADMVKKAKPCTARVVLERYIPEDTGEAEWVPKIGLGFLPDRGAAAKGKAEPGEEDEEDEPPARARRSRSRAPEPEPEVEEEEDEADDEEAADYDPDELAEELEKLSLAALKKRARDEFGVKITRSDDADAIIDKVLDTLPADDEEPDDEDEDDEEQEDEPEPPKRAARTSSRAKAAPAKKSRRSGFDEEPPF